MKAKTNNKKTNNFSIKGNIKYCKIFVGLILWSLSFSPQTVSAQRLDFSTHRGNPLVDMGQSKITFDFELNGVAKSIEILKSCAYYRTKDRNGDEFTYGIWLENNGYADHVSDEGWGIRIQFIRDSQCPVKGEKYRIIDWESDLYENDIEKVNKEVLRLRNEGIWVIHEGKVNIEYVDNVSEPKFLEGYRDGYNFIYKSLDDITKLDIIKAKKILITYVSIENNKEINLGYDRRLNFLRDIYKTDGFINYTGLLLTKKDWAKNSELVSILEQIKVPSVLNPLKYPKLKLLYKEQESGKRFPEYGEWKIGKLETYKVFFLHFVSDKYWDLRNISFSRKNFNVGYKRIIDGKRHRVKKFDTEYSKIIAGDTIINLKDYAYIYDGKEGYYSSLLWLYDPKTELMMAFKNNNL